MAVLGKIKKHGGLRLLGNYIRMGLMGEAFRQGLNVVLKRCSLEVAYSRMQTKIRPKLQRRYGPLMHNLILHYKEVMLKNCRSRRIWIFWEQGLDKAPEIVKICNQSVRKHLADYEIKTLDAGNLKEYISLPGYIEEKHRKGIIPNAQYSDLVRLELLTKYGGTWMDATVLCTGGKIPNEMFESDLFLFQRLQKGHNEFLGISNWFIHACSNHIILLLLRDMLMEYWKKNNCLMDYFLFHFFFGMIAQVFPQEIAAIPKIDNGFPHYLAMRLGDCYDDRWMQELKKRTSFHKLTYKFDNSMCCKEGTFYRAIVDNKRGKSTK